MTEPKQDKDKDEGQSINYGGSQASINKAKAESHEQDRERIAEESA